MTDLITPADFIKLLQTGTLDQVRKILEKQPELAATHTEQGLSGLMQVIYMGKMDLARLLASQRGDLSIFEAAAMGNLDRVEFLLAQDISLVNAYAPDGFQPLGLAVFFGHSQVAAYLIAFGAQVNSPSQNAQRVYPLNSAAAASNLIAARLLLANGAQVDARQAGDFTPLHNAAQNGHLQLVELLLDHGADPQARAANGKTAADFAREGGHRRIMELLQGGTRLHA